MSKPKPKTKLSKKDKIRLSMHFNTGQIDMNLLNKDSKRQDNYEPKLPDKITELYDINIPIEKCINYCIKVKKIPNFKNKQFNQQQF